MFDSEGGATPSDAERHLLPFERFGIGLLAVAVAVLGPALLARRR